MAQFIDNDLDYMLQFGGILGFEFDYDSYEDDTDSERGGEDLDFNEDNEVVIFPPFLPNLVVYYDQLVL